jgi:hypothetical protein
VSHFAPNSKRAFAIPFHFRRGWKLKSSKYATVSSLPEHLIQGVAVVFDMRDGESYKL